ncbi:hypothetical protein BDW22DRAFT_68339 [Trametopsis cervina]|nr:hypothetical protein BDW22DRAFT_68339 [Trametopsis cervina]
MYAAAIVAVQPGSPRPLTMQNSDILLVKTPDTDEQPTLQKEIIKQRASSQICVLIRRARHISCDQTSHSSHRTLPSVMPRGQPQR